ncbi:MAG: UDP-glucose 4-epimerase GalE [Oscillospiraceae bacterium]|nr:UDP-glucose 4-epimerase GalE [Oscillospiraceae bacterium]
MPHIMITGGAGYIGSHTCVQLLNAGYDIIIADNFSNSKPEVVEKIERISDKKVKLYEADMRDFEKVCEIFGENEIEAVIHFAGLKAVGESCENPLEYYHNNICGTIELLRAMKKYSCKKIVFSSSATVYGTDNPVPYIEHYPTSATNPYGYSKVAIERILIDLAAADSEWGVCLLRYFNPIGADESGLIGEEPSGIPNNLFPYIARVAIDKLSHLNVFGDDYDTPDGTGIRDYIHVVDLAKGHLNALDYVLKNTGTQAVNLGTGKGTSVLELVAAFEKASGKKIEYKIAPRRAGDIAVCYADTKKAKQILNWQAESDIDKMCTDGWRFISA